MASREEAEKVQGIFVAVRRSLDSSFRLFVRSFAVPVGSLPVCMEFLLSSSASVNLLLSCVVSLPTTACSWCPACPAEVCVSDVNVAGRFIRGSDGIRRGCHPEPSRHAAAGPVTRRRQWNWRDQVKRCSGEGAGCTFSGACSGTGTGLDPGSRSCFCSGVSSGSGSGSVPVPGSDT